MYSRELFFQEMCWLNMPLYFLHFLGRPFNYLIFLMKVFKLFWGKTSWKWKWLCILIRNLTRKLYFSITKNLRKNTFHTWLIWLFFPIFIKKFVEDFFSFFWNEVSYNLFKSLDFFPQCQQYFRYHLFLFIAYIAIDSNKMKK